jgi:hypothetical protein
MKNNLLKFYIVALFLCSTAILFAQPGTTDTAGTMENADTPPAPIDENLWILAFVGLIFVFLRLKEVKLKKAILVSKE